jgi:putative ABC transport system permease protein
MREILRLTFRNLAANKLRFLLTSFAVLMGVSFVVSSFVLTDGLTKTFNAIVEDSNSGLDAQVRAKVEFEEVDFVDVPIDEGLVDQVAAVDGVDVAEPGFQSFKIIPLDSDGDPPDTAGSPILSFNWSDPEITSLALVEGTAPESAGQFAMDLDSADRHGFTLGESYQIVGAAGPEPFELVGLTKFGEDNAVAGAVLMSFTMDEVQRLGGLEGQIHWIDVASASVDTETLVSRLNSALPADVESVSSDVVVAEEKDDFGVIVDILGNVLLGFALVAVFVSTFIIGNTFNILLGQRVKQLALIRALGASRGQVRVSSMLEALIIGVVASIVGLIGGVLLALGLRSLMNALGFVLPAFDIVISTRTVIAALAVGVGVTLVASISPARRAATVPPVAAMRPGFRFGSGEGTRRTIIAIVLAVIGVSGVGLGLFGNLDSTPLTLVTLGGGAVLVFVSVAMFAPLFSSPSASFLGLPLEHVPGSRTTGHMARENAASNNKRTASTAAGLMIGLALIGMATVVASSLKASFRDQMGSTLTADYLVNHPNGENFSEVLATEVAALPEFGEVSGVRYGSIRIDGDTKEVMSTDFSTLLDLLDVGVVAGDPASSAGPATILVHEDVAEDLSLDVGDQIVVEFAATGEQPLTVGAIYDNAFLIGNYAIDNSGWEANFDTTDINVVAASVAPDVDVQAAADALGAVESSFPQLEFETNDEFRQRMEQQLDSLLVIINVFLGLAILIALLGIANTMALAVLERTQEIGLMRAIGMTRRQTRSMIRLEAAIVSLFGALLGIVVGLFFGWVATLAIPDSIISRVDVPLGTLAIYAVIATVAGVLAASFPARRAARLNVLDAIAAS